MIELVPWMLILVWWHPDEPGKFEIERGPYLFESEDECRIHGDNRVAGVDMYHLEHGGVKVSYDCTAVPASAEYDALYAKIDDAKRQEDREMPKKSDPTAGDGQ